MKIGLYNLEPKINNSAMMQVSYYHKSLGDDVEIYKQSNHDDYDKIYAFSIFDFTDKSTVTDDMICGGTGFDIKSRLPKEIEEESKHISDKFYEDFYRLKINSSDDIEKEENGNSGEPNGNMNSNN